MGKTIYSSQDFVFYFPQIKLIKNQNSVTLPKRTQCNLYKEYIRIFNYWSNNTIWNIELGSAFAFIGFLLPGISLVTVDPLLGCLRFYWKTMAGQYKNPKAFSISNLEVLQHVYFILGLAKPITKAKTDFYSYSVLF